MEETPDRTCYLFMRDLNAIIGPSNEGKETTMRRKGLEDRYRNGERLNILRQENNFRIGGTLFMHRNIHKVT